MYRSWTTVFFCWAALMWACSSPGGEPIAIIVGDATWVDLSAVEEPPSGPGSALAGQKLVVRAAGDHHVIFEPGVDLLPPLSRGDLVINELMVNPAAVPDQQGEYIELKNLTGHTVGLSGMVLRDDGMDFHIVEGPHSVPAGGLFVLARSANTGENGGVRADYVYGGSLTLANTADEVILEYGDATIDEVEYDASWAVPKGASLELDPLLADPCCNDIEDLWCKADVPLAGGDTGSPGAENKGCD